MDNDVMPAPGELIAANGSRYHVRRFGGNSGPTILLEAGLTMMSASWGWLGPELARCGQVIAYDRAGLGWSEEREGWRDANEIAQELTALLQALEVRPPLVLLGHSMGALLHRAFLRENPEFAAAVVWLDPSHPNLVPESRRMRSFFFLLEFAHLLAARRLPSITLRIVPQLRGLPERDYKVIRWFLKNPRHLKTCAREARAWQRSAEQVREVTLGSTPLLAVTAQKHALGNWAKYQKELAGLSTKSTHVTYTDMSHVSMIARQEHAARVGARIREFLETIAL